ncbi:hypothetical protein ALC62_10175 [Cyphomyrmex costatus]|uniref:Uncharacterized protein n=1 Tax=Cyphomyrmex costatus TaxID=456900 RepID=A0A195CFH0_9HYME|nr:hypothetical protein ALC62_10175 [Cyphomyrmex costatus]
MTLWTASQLRRLTENRDRHMCQTYPGYRHSQAGQAQIGRSVIRLRADKLRVAHYESRDAYRSTHRRQLIVSYHDHYGHIRMKTLYSSLKSESNKISCIAYSVCTVEYMYTHNIHIYIFLKITVVPYVWREYYFFQPPAPCSPPSIRISHAFLPLFFHVRSHMFLRKRRLHIDMKLLRGMRAQNFLSYLLRMPTLPTRGYISLQNFPEKANTSVIRRSELELRI